MAAEGLLGDYPELRPFVLSNVRETGIKIGAGAYGSVDVLQKRSTTSSKTRAKCRPLLSVKPPLSS